MTADRDDRVVFALIPLSVVPARAIQSPQCEQSEDVGSVLGCVAQLPKALPPSGWTLHQPSSALRTQRPRLSLRTGLRAASVWSSEGQGGSMRPQHVTSAALFLPESYDLMRERKWWRVKVLTGSTSGGLVSSLNTLFAGSFYCALIGGTDHFC